MTTNGRIGTNAITSVNAATKEEEAVYQEVRDFLESLFPERTELETHEISSQMARIIREARSDQRF